MKAIELPKNVGYEGLGIAQVIEKRRSERDFSGRPMALLELSRLLYYSSGITDKRYGLRAAPSAGALYPIEVYAVVNNVDGLGRGIYRYLVQDHALEVVREGDLRQEMAHHALGQDMMAQASVVLVLTGIVQRSQSRYRDRAPRYVLLEAGHIAQNIYLVAASLGMGACAVGAFSDEGYNRMLGVDGKKEAVVYLMAVGKLQ